MLVTKTSAPRDDRATLIATTGLEILAFEQDAHAPLIIDVPANGASALQLIHAEDHQAMTQICALACEKDLRATLRVRIRKGHEWWIITSAEIAREAEGQVRIQFTADARANADKVLLHLRDLVDSAMHGAAVITDDEPIFVNRGLATMLGYDDLDDFIASGNTRFVNNIHPDDLDVVVQRVAARLKGEEESSRYEARLRKKDGSFIWVEIIAKLGEWDGRDVSISWISDIDARKRAEAALEESRSQAQAANEAKSAFLASMSHEIRTPLNGILGMAQVLAMSDLTPTQREFAKTIFESGKSLLALLNDVLDISKIEAGKVDICTVQGDLREELARVQRLFAPMAEEKGLRLDLICDDAMPKTLRFDPLRVRQCVSNLVSNAIKFTSQGRVEIAVRQRADSENGLTVDIAVIDTGSGISEDDQQRVFNAFEQVDSSATGGTGLGLAISRKLARLMGGDIRMESELGKGSTFTLSFRAPVEAHYANGEETAVAVRDEAEGKASAFSGVKALVVDDNIVNQQVAALLLGALGVTVTVAENGRAALDALELYDVDCIFLDMQMPVMDGPATLAHIRASEKPWRDVPVIAMTADAMATDRDRYLAMGMTGYIAKPISTGELEQEMSAALNIAPIPRRAAG